MIALSSSILCILRHISNEPDDATNQGRHNHQNFFSGFSLPLLLFYFALWYRSLSPHTYIRKLSWESNRADVMVVCITCAPSPPTPPTLLAVALVMAWVLVLMHARMRKSKQHEVKKNSEKKNQTIFDNKNYVMSGSVCLWTWVSTNVWLLPSNSMSSHYVHPRWWWSMVMWVHMLCAKTFPTHYRKLIFCSFIMIICRPVSDGGNGGSIKSRAEQCKRQEIRSKMVSATYMK